MSLQFNDVEVTRINSLSQHRLFLDKTCLIILKSCGRTYKDRLLINPTLVIPGPGTSWITHTSQCS